MTKLYIGFCFDENYSFTAAAGMHETIKGFRQEIKENGFKPVHIMLYEEVKRVFGMSQPERNAWINHSWSSFSPIHQAAAYIEEHMSEIQEIESAI